MTVTNIIIYPGNGAALFHSQSSSSSAEIISRPCFLNWTGTRLGTGQGLVDP